MNKQDEFEVRNELRVKRRNIDTFDQLIDFLKDVKENCCGDYSVEPRAVAQAALAVAWKFTEWFGLTGLQANYVMWDFLHDWMFTSNVCGLRIMNYDQMLEPQCEHAFQKVINQETWESLQKRAKELLEKYPSADPDRVSHWQSVVNGIVPFEYTVDKWSL